MEEGVLIPPTIKWLRTEARELDHIASRNQRRWKHRLLTQKNWKILDLMDRKRIMRKLARRRGQRLAVRKFLL